MATSATTDLWSLLAAHSPAPQCLNWQRPTILELPPRVKVPSSPQVTLLRHTGLWAPSVPVCLWFSVPAHWFRQPRPWFPGFSSTSTCGGVLRAPSWCLVGAGCVCTELPAAANSSRCTIQFNAAMLVKTLEKRGASTASGNQFHMYPVISHCQTQCCANILQMTALHNLHQKKKSPFSNSRITFGLWEKWLMPGWYEVTATELWGTEVLAALQPSGKAVHPHGSPFPGDNVQLWKQSAWSAPTWL